MLGPQTLRMFLAVADSQNFTAAAQKVGRTQSAVSQKIAKLERHLDKTLFDRGRSLSITPDGERFRAYARQIYDLQREALDHFRKPDLEGEVHFGVPEDFASVFLYDVLTDFAQIHPRVNLNVECDLTLNLYERFKRGDFDLVLVKMNRSDDITISTDVWSEPLEWVGDRSLLSDDKPWPLVLSPQPCVYRARAIKALEEAGQRWRIVFSSHSYAGTTAAVKARMGLTVLPRNMVPDDLDVIRPAPRGPALEDTHITMMKQSDRDEAVNSFEHFVIEKLNP